MQVYITMVKIILGFFPVHVHILHIYTFYRNDIKDVVLTGYNPLRIFMLKLKARHTGSYFDLLSLLFIVYKSTI